MKQRTNWRWFRGLLAGLCLAALAGCSSRGYMATVYRETANVQDRDVTLAPGDKVELKFFYAPELSDTQAVRPDGKLTLQLVGAIQAEGLTPEQLQADIEKRYKGIVDKPAVAVILREIENRVVYVGGSVGSAGKVAMPGNMTALSAIMQSGGFKLGESNPANVVVIRLQEGKYKGYLLDLSRVLQGGEDSGFYLHAQDVVYVPRTAIVDVDDWVNQHLYRILPQMGLFVSPK